MLGLHHLFLFYFFTKKRSSTNNQGKRTTEMTLDNKTKGSRGDVRMWLARLSTACKADELTPTNFSLVSTTQLIEVAFSGQ